MLTFFYDIENQPWGYDPSNLGGARVFLVEGESVIETASPDDEAEPLEAKGLAFRSSITLPRYGSRAYEALEADAGDLPDTYSTFGNELETQGATEALNNHRLLGHSANLQDDMQLEAQLVMNGLNGGDGTGYNDPRRKELEKGADDWMLLLQLDSIDEYTMWGGVGMLYFWIHKQDLAARRFDRCWMTLQCT